MAQLSRKDGVDRQDDRSMGDSGHGYESSLYHLNLGRICESKWGRHLSEISRLFHRRASKMKMIIYKGEEGVNKKEY